MKKTQDVQPIDFESNDLEVRMRSAFSLLYLDITTMPEYIALAGKGMVAHYFMEIATDTVSVLPHQANAVHRQSNLLEFLAEMARIQKAFFTSENDMT